MLSADLEDVLRGAEVVVIGNKSACKEDLEAHLRPDQIVIDLVRLPLYGSLVKADYRGICW